jgi:hypothetical protein
MIVDQLQPIIDRIAG